MRAEVKGFEVVEGLWERGGGRAREIVWAANLNFGLWRHLCSSCEVFGRGR
jgi:hypothetical protein